jgi:hypothetical protein
MRSTSAQRISPARRLSDGFGEDALVKRLSIKLESDDRRVIVRPFILGPDRVSTLFARLDQLDDARVDATLEHVRRQYESRHDDLLATFTEHYEVGAALIGWDSTGACPSACWRART